jgi:hypothetical protein
MPYFPLMRPSESRNCSAGKLYAEFLASGGCFIIADVNNDGNVCLCPICFTVDALLYAIQNAEAMQEYADTLYILCLGDRAEYNN